MTQRTAWTDERIEQLDEKIGQIHAENEALRVRMDDLSDQVANLGGEVSTRLSELTLTDEKVSNQLHQATLSTSSLAAKDEETREELLGRMNVILEEVLRENEKLRERIDSLEKSMVMSGFMHTVQRGESVASIASRYGVTPRQIVEANGLSDANLINVGQDLFIPGSAR